MAAWQYGIRLTPFPANHCDYNYSSRVRDETTTLSLQLFEPNKMHINFYDLSIVMWAAALIDSFSNKIWICNFRCSTLVAKRRRNFGYAYDRWIRVCLDMINRHGAIARTSNNGRQICSRPSKKAIIFLIYSLVFLTLRTLCIRLKTTAGIQG